MFFTIDQHNGVAIYEQLVRQVKFAIAEGTLQPGQLVPSSRVVSSQLAINPNTVARAFQELQNEEILELLRGRGLVVTAGATKRCKEMRKKLIVDSLRSVLSEALHGGLEADEIREIVRKQLDQLDGRVPTVSSGGDDSSTGS